MAAHAIGFVLMPPEPLPWDRKDFFKERKHERSESLGSVARWRDSSHHRDFHRLGSAEFRRPPGEFQSFWSFDVLLIIFNEICDCLGFLCVMVFQTKGKKKKPLVFGFFYFFIFLAFFFLGEK